MNKTTAHDSYELPRRILKKHGEWRDNPNGEIEILDAMNEYAKEEAISFATWLANQVHGGRAIAELWADYRTELGLPIL